MACSRTTTRSAFSGRSEPASEVIRRDPQAVPEVEAVGVRALGSVDRLDELLGAAYPGAQLEQRPRREPRLAGVQLTNVGHQRKVLPSPRHVCSSSATASPLTFITDDDP